MNMKKLAGKILAIVLCAGMLLSLAACSGNSSAKEKKFLVGLVIQTQSNPYFVASAERIKENALSRGWEFRLYDSQQDSQKEMQAFEDLVSLGADLIFVDNVDPEAVVASVQIAYDAGIPVIGIDGVMDPSAKTSTTITAANRDGAWECGLWLAEKKKGEAIKSALISGVKGNPTGLSRRMGLMAGIIEGMYENAGTPADKDTAWAEAEGMEAQLVKSGKAKHPTLDFEISSQGWGDWNSEGGLNAMQDILTAHTDLNVLLAENDDMAIGAMNAIAERNMEEQVLIVAGADGQKEAYRYIIDGKIGATSENNPIKIADLAYEYADKILVEGVDPESFDKHIMTEAVCVSPSNVDRYYDPNALF